MKKTRQYYYHIANKLIERFDINIFPNQLAEMLDNWDYHWKQKLKRDSPKN